MTAAYALAATNKCLAQSNKFRRGRMAIKKIDLFNERRSTMGNDGWRFAFAALKSLRLRTRTAIMF
jgi:hypothetical protein